MTRRELLLAGAAQAAMAAPIQYRDYSRCLPDALTDLATASYQARSRALDRVTTPAALSARKQWARTTLWRLITPDGQPPAKTPLNLRKTGTYTRPGYTVDKLVYESTPGLIIPANLYLPDGRDPKQSPGILFQMGHSLNGKANEGYQRACQAMARLGFVVLAFDPMGQGERVYYPDAAGKRTRLDSADDEHTVPGRQMMLFGDTSTRMQLWDAVRSLDVLETFADPARLGSTGQSGGGTLTMLLACADDRLACAAVSMGNTENFACARFNAPGSTDDAEQNFIGGGPAGFDRWDLLWPLAPKPLWIGVSAKDYFGTYSPSYLDSGREEFARLEKAYGIAGAAQSIAWYESPLPHGLSYDSRMETYRWFQQWLMKDAKPIDVEPDTQPERDETLWASPGGSVITGMKSQTPFSLNRALKVDRTPADLADLAGVHIPGRTLAADLLGRVSSRGGVEVEALEIFTAPKVFSPAWLFLPKQRDPSKPVLLLAEPSGRNGRWREDDLYWSLARMGFAVCACDVRGVGDLLPESGRGAPRYTRPHSEEEHYAWASIMLGAPLAGQRATDLLAVAAALGRHPDLGAPRVVLAAAGRLTVPALLAAALDERIVALYLSGGLVSLQSVVETEDYSHTFANFIPRLLRHTDLPEIAARIAPRKLTLAGVVDARNRPVAESAVRALYPRATVRAEAAWTLNALSQPWF